jgi:putative sigma-54 modulation protein
MNLNISFKHMDTSESLKEFIQEKTEVLKKYFDGRITVTWNLSTENQTRVAHCHLVGNNMDYFGEGNTEEFKASIDSALDKIETQIRKHKEIVKDHLHKNGHRVPA